MRVLSVLIIFSAIVLFACSKGKYSTRPSLTLKNVSTYVVPVNGSLDFTFNFTDKEGDISNLLYVRKIRMNKRAVATIRDSFALPVPQFPNKMYGEIDLNMDYNNYLVSASNPPQTGNPPKAENDTLVFKFVLKDKADNKSDTVTTNKIVIIRQ
ncbi:MAG: hypothetical protein ABI151_08715 [Chitinophagaceae bacterium]